MIYFNKRNLEGVTISVN